MRLLWHAAIAPMPGVYRTIDEPATLMKVGALSNQRRLSTGCCQHIIGLLLECQAQKISTQNLL